MGVEEIINRLGPNFPWSINNGNVEVSMNDLKDLYYITNVCNTIDNPIEYLEDVRTIKETIMLLKMTSASYNAIDKYKAESNEMLDDKYLKEFRNKMIDRLENDTKM